MQNQLRPFPVFYIVKHKLAVQRFATVDLVSNQFRGLVVSKGGARTLKHPESLGLLKEIGLTFLCFYSTPPEKSMKPKVYWCFQGV